MKKKSNESMFLIGRDYNRTPHFLKSFRYIPKKDGDFKFLAFWTDDIKSAKCYSLSKCMFIQKCLLDFNILVYFFCSHVKESK